LLLGVPAVCEGGEVLNCWAGELLGPWNMEMEALDLEGSVFNDGRSWTF
jgi:hypothetical protein